MFPMVTMPSGNLSTRWIVAVSIIIYFVVVDVDWFVWN
jgi:hypothetical protein